MKPKFVPNFLSLNSVDNSVNNYVQPSYTAAMRSEKYQFALLLLDYRFLVNFLEFFVRQLESLFKVRNAAGL